MVLERDHIVYLNGTPLILLGHNYNKPILKHHYYGSQQVIRDLQSMEGWNEGLVQIFKTNTANRDRKQKVLMQNLIGPLV